MEFHSAPEKIFASYSTSHKLFGCVEVLSTILTTMLTTLLRTVLSTVRIEVRIDHRAKVVVIAGAPYERRASLRVFLFGDHDR